MDGTHAFTTSNLLGHQKEQSVTTIAMYTYTSSWGKNSDVESCYQSVPNAGWDGKKISIIFVVHGLLVEWQLCWQCCICTNDVSGLELQIQ